MLRKSGLFYFLIIYFLVLVRQKIRLLWINHKCYIAYIIYTIYPISYMFFAIIIFMLIGCSRFVNVHLCICPFSSSASGNPSPQTASQDYYGIMSPTINYLLTIHPRSSIYGKTGWPPSLQLRHRWEIIMNLYNSIERKCSNYLSLCE